VLRVRNFRTRRADTPERPGADDVHEAATDDVGDQAADACITSGLLRVISRAISIAPR
jgi:hypothetical protein